jgi:hypothetical protein
MLYGTDSTMEKTITADLGSQASHNAVTNGSTLIHTTIMDPMMRDLVFMASDKAQNIVSKLAAGFKRDADTKFR